MTLILVERAQTEIALTDYISRLNIQLGIANYIMLVSFLNPPNKFGGYRFNADSDPKGFFNPYDNLNLTSLYLAYMRYLNGKLTETIQLKGIISSMSQI